MKRYALALLVGVALSGNAHASLMHGEALDSAHQAILQENRSMLASYDFSLANPSSAFSIDFTPRNRGAFSGSDRVPGNPSEIGMSLAISEGNPFQTQGGVSDFATRARMMERENLAESANGLSIGGALHYQQWMVGSGYMRTDLFGSRTGLWSAHLGYGNIRAGVAFGQQDTHSEIRDVMMFNTGVDAMSWLKLYGDVAIRRGESEESIAIGRLGVRLNF